MKKAIKKTKKQIEIEKFVKTLYKKRSELMSKLSYE